MKSKKKIILPKVDPEKVRKLNEGVDGRKRRRLRGGMPSKGEYKKLKLENEELKKKIKNLEDIIESVLIRLGESFIK